MAGENVLKTVGIYGANGSGKSNIILALESFIDVVGAEPTPESNLKKVCEPFLFQHDPGSTETFFQIILLLDGRKYRYGFTTKKIQKPSDSGEKTFVEVISKEWLQGVARTNMKFYFTRNDKAVNLQEPLDVGKIPSVLPHDHTLCLTHIAAFDENTPCTEVRDFLKGLTISNFSRGFSAFRWHSFIALESEGLRKQFLDIMAIFNLRYDDVQIEKDKSDNDTYRLDRVNFIKKVTHNGYTSQASLNLVTNESAGTRRLFEIAGFILRAFNMPKGGVVIIDEIDSNFHPYLVMRIVKLFNDKAANRNNCQLLFTSHDTNLLNPEILRRDQIYFTEKAADESTRLYSLADLRGIRNDADFAKQYLAGYYGAVPLLDSYLSDKLY